MKEGGEGREKEGFDLANLKLAFIFTDLPFPPLPKLM